MVDTVLQKEYERRTEHAKEFIMLQPPLLVPYYGHVASAGTGQYVFDDIPPEMIEIENEMDNMQVDFAIGVNGDSMEPTYHDGDTLLIKKQLEICVGEIGIFMISGEAFVKELGDGILISHNKKYKDIHINDSVICLGKVISKHIS
ncbi:MAG: helix-turn-helix transcriptional regulator [[Clostridium] innocuum]